MVQLYYYYRIDIKFYDIYHLRGGGGGFLLPSFFMPGTPAATLGTVNLGGESLFIGLYST